MWIIMLNNSQGPKQFLGLNSFSQTWLFSYILKAESSLGCFHYFCNTSVALTTELGSCILNAFVSKHSLIHFFFHSLIQLPLFFCDFIVTSHHFWMHLWKISFNLCGIYQDWPDSSSWNTLLLAIFYYYE